MQQVQQKVNSPDVYISPVFYRQNVKTDRTYISGL